MAGAEAAGDPIAVLPVLFHLLWRRELVTDLSVPLHPCAAVTTAAALERIPKSCTMEADCWRGVRC
jgi:hypothetical protein